MGRRAHRLIVIGVAAAAIAASGVWYAQPQWFSASRPASASGFPTLTGPYSTTYDFVTPFLGWAMVVDFSAYTTRAWMFKTTDGAGTWQREYVGRALGDRTYLHFFDQENGFAYTGYTYRTTDGGDHWEIVHVPGRRPYVTFSSPTAGWAEVFQGSSSHIYTTVDGGKAWTLRGSAPPASAVLQPISETQTSSFRDNCEGWLGGGRLDTPEVFMTVDCGQSWRSVAVSAPVAADTNVTYATTVRLAPDGDVVALVGDDQAHTLGGFLSVDGGATWRRLSLPAGVSITDEISFVDSTHWWLLRGGSIYTTDNAAASWRMVRTSGLPGGWTFAGARAIDQRDAWWTLVSGARSLTTALALTADGGAHWEMAGVPQP